MYRIAGAENEGDDIQLLTGWLRKKPPLRDYRDWFYIEVQEGDGDEYDYEIVDGW